MTPFFLSNCARFPDCIPLQTGPRIAPYEPAVGETSRVLPRFCLLLRAHKTGSPSKGDHFCIARRPVDLLGSEKSTFGQLSFGLSDIRHNGPR